MIALKITSVKSFMSSILKGNTFDNFLLKEASVSTALTHNIDGHINRDFFSKEEQTTENIPYEYIKWADFKSTCFEMIKGKRSPVFFRFVLLLMPDIAQMLLKSKNCIVDADHVEAMVLNILFSSNIITITTGLADSTFVMSKGPDNIWDEYIIGFLNSQNIEYEIM